MTYEATILEIEQAANDPSVHRYLGIDGHIDMSDYYVRPKNTAFHKDGSVILFAHVSEGMYEIHFLCVPPLRGKALLTWARELLDEMFTVNKACAIVGTPPRDNRAVRTFGTALGFKKTDIADFPDELGRTCCSYLLKASEWVIL